MILKKDSQNIQRTNRHLHLSWSYVSKFFLITHQQEFAKNSSKVDKGGHILIRYKKSRGDGMVDIRDSKSRDSDIMRVRVSPAAPLKKKHPASCGVFCFGFCNGNYLSQKTSDRHWTNTAWYWSKKTYLMCHAFSIDITHCPP